MLSYTVNQKYMDIIILLIIAFTALGFGHTLSKPINNSVGFDISINQRSYQYKIDEYLNKKYNTEKIPTFNASPVKTGEIIIGSQKSTEVRRTIKWATNPVSVQRETKTYIHKGYFKFKDTNISVHRWMMEKKLGRKLRRGEVVHHIDGNKLNNNINNLMLFSSQTKHYAYHKECKRRCGTWYAYLPNYNYTKLTA